MLGAGRRTTKQGKDYRKYRMTCKDMMFCMTGAAALTGIIAWLFYRKLWGMLLYPLVWLVFYLQRKQAQRKKQQQQLREQFKECIRIVTASMYSGYSVENAFREAEKELAQLLGESTDICIELRNINRKLGLNVPVELLMQELAERSGVEEILGFGQVFSYAKRSGSDFARILKDTGGRITDKIELERDIQVLIAGKQMEQRIMNVIPLGILFFVDFTSPGFLQIMYTETIGRIVMTICLLIYGITYLLAGKMTDIKV